MSQQYTKALKAYLAGDEGVLSALVDRGAAFANLADRREVQELKQIVDGFYHSAAEIALDEPEQALRLKGVREGIRLFFDLLGQEVASYEAAQRALVQLRDNVSVSEDLEPTEASPILFGNSRL